MVLRLGPLWSWWTEPRICQTERRWENRIHIARQGWVKRRKRQIQIDGEGRHPAGETAAPYPRLRELTVFRDKELRFTVHDSPDYYQLKVSVFNDDKKTELIGECWVALDSIVVKGGAQNDIWHSLNCKGRYAGEISLEITYYDTRPRENKVEECRPSAPLDCTPEPGRGGIVGPRQPKPVRRRPLPADPTGLVPSTQSPTTPPTQQQHRTGSVQQQYAESPDDYRFYTPPQENPQDMSIRGPPVGYQSQSQRLYDSTPPPELRRDYPSSAYQSTRGPPSHDVYGQPNTVSPSPSPEHGDFSFQDRYSENGLEAGCYETLQSTESLNNRASMPTVAPLHILPPQAIKSSTRSLQPHSSPTAVSPQAYHSSSLSQSVSADVSPISSPSRQNSQEAWPEISETIRSDDARPPQPPAHRTSASRLIPQAKASYDSQAYGHTPAAPAPFRGNTSGSPLSQIHSVQSDRGLMPPASQNGSYGQAQHASTIASQTSYSQLRQRRSHSPARDIGQHMPPSLVPGYEQRMTAEESDRILREQQMSARQNFAGQQSIPHQQFPSPTVQSRSQPLPRGVESVHDRRTHRNSAPIFKPGSVAANPRTPMRKSVSPQPGSAPTERRHSEVPFSPDSFNSFNPNLDLSNDAGQMGARYDTPDKAREASIQHDRDVKRGNGPIIGSDGRIIDPSDHLPTDTWAPEPEQKTPRKGPEVKLRFRHSPQGAQPMPPVGRRPLAEARPNAMSTASSPIFTQGALNGSASTDRARLQKKSRGDMMQPASSPAVPTLQTMTPLHGAMPRSSISDHPLRERDNYNYNGSSPTYGNRSPGSIPPQVPGKVPLRSAQEDWGRDALSEEMSRIDIGVGNGHRARPHRYGF